MNSKLTQPFQNLEYGVFYNSGWAINRSTSFTGAISIFLKFGGSISQTAVWLLSSITQFLKVSTTWELCPLHPLLNFFATEQVLSHLYFCPWYMLLANRKSIFSLWRRLGIGLTSYHCSFLDAIGVAHSLSRAELYFNGVNPIQCAPDLCWKCLGLFR